MGYKLNFSEADGLIRHWRQHYRVFAPKRLTGRGWRPGTDLIRYGEINSMAEIVTDEPSDFSPKDVIFPIVQTTQFFTADSIRESAIDDRGILLFARPCDINGIRRLDTIFLENGGLADYYYQRLRDKLKIVLLECREGWDSCFCVAMGASRTGDYSLAVRISGQEMLVEVRDEDFTADFAEASIVDFVPEFPQADKKKVVVPAVSKGQLEQVRNLKMWEDYDSQCVSCGSCNTVCTTCSCFDTKDIIYHETSRDGERRRVWSSCMLEDFSTMAGGHGVRKTAGERMRFKTLHKIYDFQARFGNGQMCVGCGRCDRRCPEKISFADTISRLGAAIDSREVNQP